MFIMSNRNLLLPGPKGQQPIRIERGFIGEIPEWAASTRYFQALVKDGKIAVPQSKKDKDLQDASEKPQSDKDDAEKPQSDKDDAEKPQSDKDDAEKPESQKKKSK